MKRFEYMTPDEQREHMDREHGAPSPPNPEPTVADHASEHEMFERLGISDRMHRH